MIARIHDLKKVKQAIKDFPIVIFENGNGTEKEVYDLLEAINGEISNKVFNPLRVLKVENTINQSVGASGAAHPPHTDACYRANPPSHIILQCVEPDKKQGGLGLFWSLGNLFKYLPSEYANALQTYPIEYARLREDGHSIDKHTGYILNKKESNYGDIAIRWRYDQQLRPKLQMEASSTQMETFTKAITYCMNYFQTEPPTITHYKKGDILIASNEYLTHGRTRILDSTRMMRRAWLNLTD